MPVYTEPDKIPAPADTGEPPAAYQLQDMADFVQLLITGLRQDDVRLQQQALTAAAEARSVGVDARSLDFASASGSGQSAEAVTTGSTGIGGAALDLPAGRQAFMVAMFDVTCDVYNADSTFIGALNLIDRRDNSSALVPNLLARWTAIKAGTSGTPMFVRRLGAANFLRTFQLHARKTTTGAGIQLGPANCHLMWVTNRSGSLA